MNGAGTRRARRFASLLLLVGLLWLGSRASTADNPRRSSEGEYASQIYRGVAEGARAFIHHDAHRARDRGPYERPSILLLGDSPCNADTNPEVGFRAWRTSTLEPRTWSSADTRDTTRDGSVSS